VTTLSPNIENITLENWLEPDTREKKTKQVYHFAVRQNGLSLDFHLQQFFRGIEISLHYFHHFDTLTEVSRHFPLAAILIGGKGDFFEEVQLVHSIKQNIFLSIVPVILFHPDPEVNSVVAAFENGAEEFIHGEWIDRLVEVRIKRVIERSRRDLAVNPSTQLPGTAIIEREIKHHLDMRTTFALCYADLDNFKAYNDYYGYHCGDKVVRLTSRILKDVVFDLCREGFVGHIAGDDFVFLIPNDLIDTTCQWIIKTFDAVIPYRYEQVDRERGFITTLNRRGQSEDYPILTISIAVIINSHGQFQHLGELSKMLADLKKATKQRPGSNYLVERRQKY
jgi:diguanylate cyclase (GGDEF)-like protein